MPRELTRVRFRVLEIDIRAEDGAAALQLLEQAFTAVKTALRTAPDKRMGAIISRSDARGTARVRVEREK
jgi:hypothetical protein